MSPDASQRPFAFGKWQVHPSRGLLIGAEGESTRLEPRLMDLLLLFAGSGGRVLGKNEITAATWGDRPIGDDTLAAAVSRLRRALGGTRERRYIETVPKRGYRLAVDAAPKASDQRVASEGPPEAAALVAQGRRALASLLPANLAQARVCFEAAMANAPSWSPAHQGLADVLIARHFMEQGGDLVAAKAAARAAVGLDETSATAWATLGMALLLADSDFAAADTAFQRAIALDPRLVTAHRRRAMALTAVGRFAEAERAVRRAMALEPNTLDARCELLEILLAAGRYRHAAAEAAAVLSLAPDLGDAWYQRGWALTMAGDPAEGFDCLLKGLELRGFALERLRLVRTAFEARGFGAACAATADLFAEQPVAFLRRGMQIVVLRAVAGQPDEAFAILDAAAARGDPALMFLPWLPWIDNLRSDPRYAPLVSRARLVA